jgi:hypothetical protein
LQNNDVIELGKYRIRYLADNAAPEFNAPDFDKTQVLRPGQMPKDLLKDTLTESQYSSPAKAMGMASDTDFGNTAAADFGSGLPRAMPLGALPPAAHAAMAAARAAAVHSPALPPATQDPALAAAHAAKLAQLQNADTQYMEPDVDAMFAPKAAAAKPKNFEGKIRILNGGNTGKEMVLVKMVTTIGRPGGQVAVISKKPDGFYVNHVEGTVTPKVNGAEIGTSPMRLASADTVEIAGVKMEFMLI